VAVSKATPTFRLVLLLVVKEVKDATIVTGVLR